MYAVVTHVWRAAEGSGDTGMRLQNVILVGWAT